MAFCKNCGNEYQAGAKFCRSCGNALPARKAEPERKTSDAPVSLSHSDTPSAPPKRPPPVKSPLAPVDSDELARRVRDILGVCRKFWATHRPQIIKVSVALFLVVGGYTVFSKVKGVIEHRRIDAQEAQQTKASQQNAATLPNALPPQFEKGEADIEDAVDKNTGLEMVAIPGGTFSMGSVESGAEQPIRRVKINAFSMRKNDVTVGEYEAYCVATGTKMPLSPDFNKDWSKKNHPIVKVSWDDANGYCQWLSQKTGKTYDLPTEAEWEYAARGGLEGKKYPWGDDWDISKCANSVPPNRLIGTVPVGSYPVNGYGLHDMAGNIWQWCKDWKADHYEATQVDNPTGPASGVFRVSRGGSWSSVIVGPEDYRVAYRDVMYPSGMDYTRGFRVVYREEPSKDRPISPSTTQNNTPVNSSSAESKPRPTETQSSVSPQPGVSGADAVAAYIIAMGSQRFLSDSDLAGKSAWELTVMRNAPYAKHGYLFGNARLRALFSKEAWYRSETDNMSLIESRLSAIEKKNVAFISSYQEKNHLKLNLKALP